MARAAYVPRPGTKPARALAALADGPLSRCELARRVNVPAKQINSAIERLLATKLVLSFPVEGEVHLRLRGQPVEIATEPRVGVYVARPSVQPTAAAIRAANPFGIFIA